MQIFSKTLHKKILLLIVFVGVLPAIAGIVQVYWGSMIAVNKVIGEYCENQASRLSQEIGNIIDEKSNTILDIKKKPDFLFMLEASIDFQAEGFGRENVSSKFLQNLVKDTPLQGDLIFISTNKGDVLAATNTEKLYNYSQDNWWRGVLEIDNEKIYLADFYDKNDDNVKIVLATPIFLYGKNSSVGVLFVIVNKAKIYEKIESIQAGEGIFFTLYSTGSYFLYNHGENSSLQPLLMENELLVQKKLSGFFLPKSNMQGKYIISFSHIKLIKIWNNEGKSKSDWIVISKFEIGRIVTFINLLLWRLSIFGGVVVIIICLLGLYISNRIVRPIKDLRTAAQQLAEGNLNYRVSVKTSDELEILAETFNDMAERLKITYDDLAMNLVLIDEKARQISLIHEVTKAINSAFDLNQIFKILASEINKIVFYDRLTIAFIDEEDPGKIRFDFVAPEDTSVHYVGQKLNLENTKYEECMKSQTSILISEPQTENISTADRHLLDEQIQSCLIIPIFSQKSTIGFFALASKTTNTYDENDMEILNQISEALAVAVEHSHLYHRISKFAVELEEKIRERTRELETAQVKLVQTERFAATGKLAANLAHEINNPLGIIKNYIRIITDMLKNRLTPDKNESDNMLFDNLNVVKEELDRIARIVRSLLDFYKSPDSQQIKNYINLNYEINQLSGLMKNSFDKKKIGIVLNLDKNIPNIFIPQDALRQILLNLLRNAEDAIENEGTITISTLLLKSASSKNNSGSILLTVKDTGCGIPYHHLNKIFDPFFTTKKEKGTGLGLSVTYGLVHSLGGTIEVDSILKKGTSIKITIPVENENGSQNNGNTT